MIGNIMQSIILKLHQDYTSDQLKTLAKVVEEKLVGVYVPENLSDVWIRDADRKHIKLKDYY
tara:strand:- start:399 stop:584 length:186 start_codon:yes stop_codon:yes gene_type:complete